MSRPSGRLALGVGALGVVFGDIGTSPLYAYQEIFAGPHVVEPLRERALGSASLVLWTLTLVVSVKYVLIVMRADNDGEGGIIALASLAVGDRLRRGRATAGLMALGIAGAALFYGDGMITPAVSVLSAVEGLEVAAPGLSSYVVPVCVVVLVLLFAVQRHGPGRLGAAFGPVMLVWFACIAALGLASTAVTPEVVAAVSPTYAVTFLVGDPLPAFLTLGSVVLCVTGAEALYADMGQFGRSPIRLSWFWVAMPALMLNYLGQSALVLRDPSAVSNPFYLIVPSPLQLPMVVLATLATLIASQAVISGAFSMTRQAIHLDYLPRMRILHTSSQQRGQVYVPAVNWLLGVSVIGLVVAFGDSSGLASAYGIAVTGTFLITTSLITVVALRRWRLDPRVVWPVSVLFLAVDGAFFAACLTKFGHGGWVPLAVALVVFVVLTTWRRGRTLLLERLSGLSTPLGQFAVDAEARSDLRTLGTAVYVAVDDSAPYALVRHERVVGVLASSTVILRLVTTDTAYVDDATRVDVERLTPSFWRVTARFGFVEAHDGPLALRLAAAHGLELNPDDVAWVLNRVEVEPGRGAGMALPRQHLYAVMQRLSVDPSLSLHLPTEQVLEVGGVVRLGRGPT